MRRILLVLCVGLWGLGLPAGPGLAAEITIFAAASTRGALEEAAALFTAETGHDVRVAPAGSSLLARQIDRGAPADLFLSANPGWMDWLAERDHVREETRRDLLGNALVLIGPAGGEAEEVPLEASALTARLGPEGRIALALTDAVPAGLYARAAFEALGLWGALGPRRVEADNVRAALALVALGAAPLGVVYASDARAEPRVRILARIPEAAHPPIRYPAAVLREARAPAAAEAFLTWLAGPEARAIFDAHGFAAPPG